jgi:hypothetical protein
LQIGDCGLLVADWGMQIADLAAPIRNPQLPIPNPQSIHNRQSAPDKPQSAIRDLKSAID